MRSKIFLFNSFLLASLSFLLLNNCTPTEPQPPEDDIVPQHKIPWPSLADTPWPMYHHDPQSTGRSEYKGPTDGFVDIYTTPETMMGITIGYDNHFFYVNTYTPYYFISYDLWGNENWKIFADQVVTTTPILTRDSLLIIAGTSKISAYSIEGDRMWDVQNPDGQYISGININYEGNIFIQSYTGHIYSIDKGGGITDLIYISNLVSELNSNPSFSPDGKTLYLMGEAVSLISLDVESRKVNWIWGDIGLRTSPLVDNAGNIYVIPGTRDSPSKKYFYSINPDGLVNWEFKFKSLHLPSNINPTIDNNGNLFFGTDTLYSLTNSGILRWLAPLNGFVHSPLICDSGGNIYVGTAINYANYISSFNNDGKLLWSTTVVGIRVLGSSPAISENGNIVFPTFRDYYYLIIR